ncbi:MAG: DUF72 domain-containing protein [Gemmatimonadaceae bacterium]
MNLRTGTSGYSYKEWKGKFYPEKLAATKMLHYYGEHFGTVEINYTFRAIPTTTLLEKWVGEVPKDFQFVLKAPQTITHHKKLVGCEEIVANFFDIADAMKKSLGPVLFQLPETFKKDADRLRNFLTAIPAKKRVAFEFRSATWFDDEIYDLLRKNKAAFCVADADNDLDVPFVATTDWGFMRLRRTDYSDAELKKWLKTFREQTWNDVYVFFRHEDDANGPRLAKRLMELAK